MINNCYNFKELKEKFGWEGGPGEISRQITYAKRRGVEIEPAFKQGSTYFRILSNNEQVLDGEEWRHYPKQPNLKVSNLGRVQDTLTKKFLDKELEDGYRGFSYNGKNYRIHRLVMETFNPIENCNEMVVDHINGIKYDNRLENLQWKTSEENLKLSAVNRQTINFLINDLIQKYGYEKTTQALLNLSSLLAL